MDYFTLVVSHGGTLSVTQRHGTLAGAEVTAGKYLLDVDVESVHILDIDQGKIIDSRSHDQIIRHEADGMRIEP